MEHDRSVNERECSEQVEGFEDKFSAVSIKCSLWGKMWSYGTAARFYFAVSPFFRITYYLNVFLNCITPK